MMKQLKKVLSIMCAIALLISSMTFALAEDTENEEAIITAQQEESQTAEDEAAAQAAAEAEAAAKAAEEEAAAQAAAEAEAAAKAAEEEAAAQAAAEAEAAAKAAEEEAAAQAAAEAEAAAKAAEEEAAAKAAEEEAAAQAAAEAEAAAKAAEEEAAAKAAEEEAAAQAAAEAEAAAKAAEEEAAAKAAEEEAAAQAAAEAEAAAKAAEEEAAAQAAAEEEAAAKAAEEEAAAKAAEEEAAAQAAEEEAAADTEEDDEDEEDEEGLVQLDDGDGYIDQEVIDEKTPAITDELKGIRSAELFVGEVLNDSIRFGDELTITLKGCDVSTVDLKLYVTAGTSVNTKVDGKAVSFTPADSDVPSMDLYTYELTNAAGISHEIVLTSYDTVSFTLAASVQQVEEITEEPAAQEEEVPAEGETEAPAAEEETPAETPAEEAPSETPAPTIQASVKTYDSLKVGSSISDTLVAGQKAKIQVKCGKNPYVTLVLSVNPDDVTVTIDGQAAEFTAAGNGTYTCELDDVAFRKFSVIISAKQDLAFSLSAEARLAEEGEEADEEEAEEEETEESAEEIPADEDINMEETGEQPAEEVTEESAEETEEGDSETVTEETEETEESEEAEKEESEETEEAAEESEETEEAEPSEEEGEKAEGEEENTEEESEEEPEEETEEETEEEAEEAEPLTDEQIAELGYHKVVIENKNGADIYAGTEEAEAIAHADLGSELWIKDAETEGWAEIYTEEETKQYIKLAEIEKQPLTDEEIEALGYSKVQILNQNGTDIYDSTEEEAAVIGHADFESEIWIKDAEAEGWAEIFSEEETKQYVKLAEIEKQMPSDEEMLEAGYIKVYVAIDIGANVYDSSVEYEGEEPVDHLDASAELWVKLIDGAERALIYDMDEEAPARYINLVDIIATMKPEGMEELPTRMLEIHSSLEEYNFQVIFIGVNVTLYTDLINFREDDVYTVQWQYSVDGEEFIDIEGANELAYQYLTDENNVNYIWKVQVILQAPDEAVEEIME